MFEQQYDAEMEAEIRGLEGKQRASAAGHPEWESACKGCRSQLSRGVEWCRECARAS